MSDFWMQIVYGLLLMFMVMSGTWYFSKRWNNYSVVDAVWSFSFALMAAFFASMSEGWMPRKILLVGVVFLWSIRLGVFLARRIYSHHPLEDERYKSLRADYGARVPFRFFMFFQYQGISVVALSFLFLEILRNPTPTFSAFEIAGFILSILSLMGESVADSQANRFKSNPANKLRVCDVGLWKYSRHPNYFFESMIWWGFYLAALGTAGAGYTIYAPLIILFILLKVTGVPPSEAQALKKRGDAYRQYQKRTSVFVPWFPRKGD
ncbi:DUF1295 domain-containing protein [Bdellovibrio sp. HCB2-146]|uniref:DUF1295 domain-containing protein n=1 Tax=Bdellovibrio sp. HCB2-146 TaxID=3394362 RepID=UPI0039BD7102